MRNTIFKIGRFAVIAALMLVPTIAHAQLTATAPVTVSLNVTESISASAPPRPPVFTDHAGFGGTRLQPLLLAKQVGLGFHQDAFGYCLGSARRQLRFPYLRFEYPDSGANRSEIQHHTGQRRRADVLPGCFE